MSDKKAGKLVVGRCYRCRLKAILYPARYKGMAIGLCYECREAVRKLIKH